MHRRLNDNDNFSKKYNMETSKEFFEGLDVNKSIKNAEKNLEKNDTRDGFNAGHMTRKMFED